MTNDLMQQIVEAIVNGTFLYDWLTYALTLLVIYVYLVSPLYKSYFAKLGEQAAEKANRKNSKIQLAEDTELRVAIEKEYSQKAQDRALMREKLESVFFTTTECLDHIARLVNSIGIDKISFEKMPIDKLKTLVRLDFPKCAGEFDTLRETYFNYIGAYVTLNNQLLETGKCSEEEAMKVRDMASSIFSAVDAFELSVHEKYKQIFVIEGC